MLMIKRLKEGFSDNSFIFGRIMINLQKGFHSAFLVLPYNLERTIFKKVYR